MGRPVFCRRHQQTPGKNPAEVKRVRVTNNIGRFLDCQPGAREEVAGLVQPLARYIFERRDPQDSLKPAVEIIGRHAGQIFQREVFPIMITPHYHAGGNLKRFPKPDGLPVKRRAVPDPVAHVAKIRRTALMKRIQAFGSGKLNGVIRMCQQAAEQNKAPSYHR